MAGVTGESRLDGDALNLVRRNLVALRQWDMLSMDSATFVTWCTGISEGARLADGPWAVRLIDEALAALDGAIGGGDQ